MIWYAAYGSNLALDRLMRYLEGGRPPGSKWTAPGARDRTPPRDFRPYVMSGNVYFAWESPSWGGGIAFWAPGDGAPGTDGSEHTGDPERRVRSRVYQLTTEQFCDIAAQEMHEPSGTDLDLAPLLEKGEHAFGPGRYETMRVVGEIEGDPVITFTAPDKPGEDALGFNAPVDAYLQVMGRGVCAAHGWNASQAADYLLGCWGVNEGRNEPWDAARLTALIDR